jgi:hypothetical protein
MSNIIILDTGDNYIISLNNESITIVVNLYQLLDVSVNLIETDYTVDQDILKFIYDNIGHIISYGFADTGASTRIDILTKLLQDIKTTIEFYKIKRFWLGINSSTVSELNYEFNECLNEEINLVSFDRAILTKVEDTSGTYIIYNNIYNLSFVYDLPNNSCLKDYTEFDIIEKIDLSNINELKQHFHKVSFLKREDLNLKLEAFKKLYNYNIPTKQSEKEQLKKYLETNFILSNDLDKRIKANDFYKELINYMCIRYQDMAHFKKRVAGYLLEFNLQKKRFSDAYYYYGLTRKENKTPSLKELEEMREKERIEFKFSSCKNPFIYGKEDEKEILENKFSSRSAKEREHKILDKLQPCYTTFVNSKNTEPIHTKELRAVDLLPKTIPDEYLKLLPFCS